MSFAARLRPRSLQGQVLLAIALALLVAQGIGAALLWRAQAERREAALVSAAAFRLTAGQRAADRGEARPWRPQRRGMRLQEVAADPTRAGERRQLSAERALGAALADEGVRFTAVRVVERPIAADPAARRWMERREARKGPGWRGDPPDRIVITALRRPDGGWLVARQPVVGREGLLLGSLLLQTVLLYAVLVGVMALLLRRITRPLAALTERVERFARAPEASGQLEPSGPQDVRRLIGAHNAMEHRIAALLDEKNVMLGAIGHDLKTPLAALRVRIEAIDDDAERARMAAGIDEIARALDDILSLARVGRPSDPIEPTELGALVASVIEEYEDMGEPVIIAASERIVLPLRPTWVRRSLRNLIDNALRYGQRARVSLAREGAEAIIRIEDDGPGIPAEAIPRMMEPFTRLEASRNSATGGAGLGLTLARAVAEQHGGALALANREEERRVAGLVATLRLPLA